MVINVASFGGRTHMLDLARELSKHGHTVRFYSYVPTKRAVKFGLPKECSYSYFYLAVPFLFLLKCTNFSRTVQMWFYKCFDFILAYIMKPCDILICQGPMFLYSIKYAHKKGRIVILERGISHILEYCENLKNNPTLKGKPPIRKDFIQRDLDSFLLADYISVGANHVKNSFTRYGIPESKVFLNNYGCSLDDFHPTELDKTTKPFDLLMVGQWCYRKGCDLITEYVKKHQEKSLLHIGSIVDCPFPQLPNAIHKDAVDEKKLITYYKQARVFILPSREEGLALVQVQAITCGLPLVCSKKSGGEDLKQYVREKDCIVIIEDFSIASIEVGVERALAISHKQIGTRSLVDKEHICSWENYGKRYNEFIQQIRCHNENC